MLNQNKNYKDIIFVGVVVNNQDPQFLERVKIRIPEIFDGVVDTDLPWAIPSMMSSVGRIRNVGTFGPPLVGSKLYIKFQNGDSHFPMYLGFCVDFSNKIDVAQVHYPHRHGWIDAMGNIFYIDTQTNDVQFIHSSGSTIHIDSSGNATQIFMGNYHVTANSIEFTSNSTTTLTSSGTTTVSAPDTSISGTANIGGDTTIAGSTTLQNGMDVTGGIGSTFSGTITGIADIALTGSMTIGGNLAITGSSSSSNYP